MDRSHIFIPTRISDVSITLINQIFDNVECSGVRDIEISDQMLVYCNINLEIYPPSYSFTYRNLQNINVEQFHSDIDSLPWHIMYNMADID